ncbi:MAG: HD domain-containing protein [Deltaproteobacteria bacterium]|nr:HD domain-containing protein [Deltaproteobacteria bacterium]
MTHSNDAVHHGERQWVADLQPGDDVRDRYLVWRKNLLMAKNGRPYVSMVLGDHTGKIETRIWDHADNLATLFEAQDVIEIKGRVIKYQDHRQLNVIAVKRIPTEDVDITELLPTSRHPIAEMMEELTGVIASIHKPPLRRLLETIVALPDVKEGLLRAPAAKTIHHAWTGGLLEHTLSVCRLLDSIWTHYDAIFPGMMDRDILMAGGILHDLGKIWELGGITFEYTDRGKLLGHMALVYEVIDHAIREQEDFPADIEMHLKHLVLSHHGQLEYGSPKRPKTAEAWALHYADILDGRMTWLNALTTELEPGEWSTYQRLYDRYFWKPPRHGDAIEPSSPNEFPDPSEAEASDADQTDEPKPSPQLSLLEATPKNTRQP